MAGFGKRQNHYCITDIKSPEAFVICGSPQTCDYRNQYLTKCGLDFLYKGKRHTKCIKGKPPSSDHPMCQAYSRSIGNKTM